MSGVESSRVLYFDSFQYRIDITVDFLSFIITYLGRKTTSRSVRSYANVDG
ncbi:MAG: hypothetical protein ACI8RD_013706 [Bacillariaceae sp.]|jgi:hypothetical protein